MIILNDIGIIHITELKLKEWKQLFELVALSFLTVHFDFSVLAGTGKVYSCRSFQGADGFETNYIPVDERLMNCSVSPALSSA